MLSQTDRQTDRQTEQTYVYAVTKLKNKGE
jgi:hypothetical protein